MVNPGPGVTPESRKRVLAFLVKRAPGALHVELRKAFTADVNEWFGEMAMRFRAPLHLGPGPNPNDTVHNRTGAARRSLGKQVTGTDLGSLKARAVSRGVLHVYGLEKGQVVRPKNVKNLTIPLKDNMTAAGVMRENARSALEKPGTYFLRSKNGKLFIVRDPKSKRKFSDRKAPVQGPKQDPVQGPRKPSKKRKKKKGKPRRLKFLFLLTPGPIVTPGPDTTGAKSRLGFFDTWERLAPKRRKRHGDAVRRAIMSAGLRGGGAGGGT